MKLKAKGPKILKAVNKASSVVAKLVADKKPATTKPKKEASRASARVSKSKEPKHASLSKEKAVLAKP